MISPIATMATCWVRIKRISAAAWLLCFVLVVAGCGREPMGRVTGVVTFQGQPLTQGLVGFQNDALGVHMMAPISSNGSFDVRMAQGQGLPLGNYRVFVAPPLPDLQLGAPDPNMPALDVSKFPPKYMRVETSELSLTVVKGENRLDIDMKP